MELDGPKIKFDNSDLDLQLRDILGVSMDAGDEVSLLDVAAEAFKAQQLRTLDLISSGAGRHDPIIRSLGDITSHIAINFPELAPAPNSDF